MAFIDWPSADNYFGFYGLAPVYEIDAVALKQLFLEKSRQFHPDYFGEDMEAQAKAIEITAYNNKAYKTLGNPIERIRYLIDLNNPENSENVGLPNEFLMEMMDLNEKIDEFEFSENSADLKSSLEAEIKSGIDLLKSGLIDLAIQGQWESAKNEMLKLTYLERLSGRLYNAGN